MSDTYRKEFSIFISTTPVVNKIVLSLDETIKELSIYFNNCGAEWDGELHKKLGFFVDEFAELEVGKSTRIEFLNGEWASITRCFPSFAETNEIFLQNKIKFAADNAQTKPYLNASDELEKAAKDIILFERRQHANSVIDRNEGPIKGDIIMIDGVKKYVSWDRNRDSGTVSLSNGGSFHLCSSGTFDFSGTSCTGLNSTIETKSLIKTDSTDEIYCWIFSQDDVGPHRGVYWTIRVPVWIME